MAASPSSAPTSKARAPRWIAIFTALCFLVPVEFTGSVGSDPPGFDIGEGVTVLYDPANPKSARIDAFFQLWSGSWECSSRRPAAA